MLFLCTLYVDTKPKYKLLHLHKTKISTKILLDVKVLVTISMEPNIAFFTKVQSIFLTERHLCCFPNGHTTSNPRRFNVDITSIHRRPNFDEFPRHFRVLFRCNFDGRKIHVVSTYSFQCNFSGRKIHVASTYFFRCNFTG